MDEDKIRALIRDQLDAARLDRARSHPWVGGIELRAMFGPRAYPSSARGVGLKQLSAFEIEGFRNPDVEKPMTLQKVTRPQLAFLMDGMLKEFDGRLWLYEDGYWPRVIWDLGSVKALFLCEGVRLQVRLVSSLDADFFISRSLAPRVPAPLRDLNEHLLDVAFAPGYFQSREAELAVNPSGPARGSWRSKRSSGKPGDQLPLFPDLSGDKKRRQRPIARPAQQDGHRLALIRAALRQCPKGPM